MPWYVIVLIAVGSWFAAIVVAVAGWGWLVRHFQRKGRHAAERARRRRPRPADDGLNLLAEPEATR
jgi:hypothetical protein